MPDVTHPPLWLVALLVAGAAPWFAGALQALFESRLRRRTDAVLARAFATLDPHRPHPPAGMSAAAWQARSPREAGGPSEPSEPKANRE